jgi:hypothetical protein
MNLARTIATATIVLLALAAAPAAPATLVPLEDFAKDEAVSLVRLSPDGKRIAIVYSRAGINNLAVIEIATMAANVVAGFKLPGQIGWVRWVSDERMVLEVHEWVAGRAFVSSLVTVRRNDQRPAYLFDNRRAPVNWYVDESIVDLVKGSPDEILLQSNLRNAEFPDVHRLQLAQPHTPTPNAQARTNLDYAPTKRSIEVTAPARACDYLADHAGVVRSCLSYEVDGSMRLMYRASATAEWSELEKYSLNAPYLLPVGFTPDNARILALSNVDRDRRALVEYDPAERRATQVVYEHPEVDLASALFYPPTAGSWRSPGIPRSARSGTSTAARAASTARSRGCSPGVRSGSSTTTRTARSTWCRSAATAIPEPTTWWTSPIRRCGRC